MTCLVSVLLNGFREVLHLVFKVHAPLLAFLDLALQCAHVVEAVLLAPLQHALERSVVTTAGATRHTATGERMRVCACVVKGY